MTTLERFRECGKPAELHVLGEDAAGIILQMVSEIAQTNRPQAGWQELARQLAMTMRGETATVEECPFEGDVEVLAEGIMGPNVKLTWKCPTCGADHEEVD